VESPYRDQPGGVPVVQEAGAAWKSIDRTNEAL
jgi:hypothetical protein